MAGAIIWYITMFGCGALFYGIGVYAGKLEKPMSFWSGTQVDPKEIWDIPQYNLENSRMWKCYSLWYFDAGMIWHWSELAALVLLLSGCFLGIPLLVFIYSRIYKKYSVHTR